jgi:glucose-6-phosphate 1-dehydrogenase
MDGMTFILFGATGDLAKRKIFPAIYNLFLDEKLPRAFAVFGTGRRDMSDEDFRAHVEQSVKTFSRRWEDDRDRAGQFLSMFHYCAMDVTQPQDYGKLAQRIRQREQEGKIPENRIYSLSVAPELFGVIASNISASELGSATGWKRLIIEKPFGHDLQSARDLNRSLRQFFDEEEIFRIDHYLGKPMVQNLEVLEFANPILRTLWNNQHIANVQITASETVGVEERAGYYDKAGAIRDMFQNHLLQLLMMTAMQMPRQFSAREIRNEKIKVLKALRPLRQEDVAAHVVRGQYGKGWINGKPAAAYRDEPGVDRASNTDTFVAARLWIDNAFWSGVPFYIRTGKRMREKSTRIVIEFKNPLRDAYPVRHEKPAPNLLVIHVNPYEGVSFQLNSKHPGKHSRIEPITMEFAANANDVPEAYELLLYDALRGDSTFFAHWEEVELCWKWVQPILDAFSDQRVPLHLYEAGTQGPEAAFRLLEEDGFSWWELNRHAEEGTLGVRREALSVSGI